jgi:hypothetical protein
MAKGWETLPTIYTADFNEKTKKWKTRAKKKEIPQNTVDNFIKNQKRLTYNEIIKEGEAEYAAQIRYEDQLIEAYEANKIKSKNLLKEVRKAIKAKRKRLEESNTSN